MSEFFATIFWRVLCEWSCGSLIAFFSRNWHSFPDGNHYHRGQNYYKKTLYKENVLRQLIS